MGNCRKIIAEPMRKDKMCQVIMQGAYGSTGGIDYEFNQDGPVITFLHYQGIRWEYLYIFVLYACPE
jgi:hypothetical protein